MKVFCYFRISSKSTGNQKTNKKICIYICIYIAAHGSWDKKYFFKRTILKCNYVIKLLTYISKIYVYIKINQVK